MRDLNEDCLSAWAIYAYQPELLIWLGFEIMGVANGCDIDKSMAIIVPVICKR